ncbi:helix-turn-helix domain-containing protein [Streptomyces sp. NBC_00249]|uniref:helix-turn-helix domain-containing protein n=1 Tax=Streptomyces sp. NBC_00249 TaxID=2975690 RepID=UPI002250C885|nr:helix-turn-helix transcriptional regulator [Streptomyces sp. NBC_00249]MCX5199634.1 helix-turn-helix domain-containing protein [Streptomyces sp. NBC_00249]
MADHIGQRIATRRRARRMTQADLAREAHVSLAMIKACERGVRTPGPSTLEAIASALAVDASRLDPACRATTRRVHASLPSISAAIAGYEYAMGPSPRPLPQLRADLHTAVGWRLAAQYGLIATRAPELLADTLACLHTAAGVRREDAARLVVTAARTADAVAYKFGAHDLSARLIDVMRWAAVQVDDPAVHATVAYVRAETFLAARAHRVGQIALEQALDAAPAPGGELSTATRGALHMRTAVVAARAADPDAAYAHLREARRLAEGLREGIYLGTAFGPSSIRIHEVALSVSLGRDHIGHALNVAREWRPGDELPAERRSGFWIEVARAQLWSGDPDGAFESLKAARSQAPQHVREHPWAREDIEKIRRLKRADATELTHYAEWIGAV